MRASSATIGRACLRGADDRALVRHGSVLGVHWLHRQGYRGCPDRAARRHASLAGPRSCMWATAQTRRPHAPGRRDARLRRVRVGGALGGYGPWWLSRGRPPPSSATPSTFGLTGRSRARMRSFIGFWTSCWVQPSSSWRSREPPECPDPSRGVTRKTVPTLIVVHNA